MADAVLARPEPNEYSSAVTGYIRLVPAGDLLSLLDGQADELATLLGKLSDAEALVRHPPYTWNIKQVVGHLNDCERVFGYRAMRLARNDRTELPGFDENAYVAHADFDRFPLAEQLSEFVHLRRGHVAMFRHLEADAWLRSGVVNNHAMTVRAIACVMAGHTRHHQIILQKRLAG